MDNVRKSVAILTLLSNSGNSMGITQIAKSLTIGKNNVHRILSALVEEGWIEQKNDQQYRITGVMAGVGLRALALLDLQTVVQPYLYELQDITGETSVLAVRIGFKRMFVYQVPSSQEIRIVSPIGQKFDLWSGSSGKSMLAFMQDEEIEQVISEFKKSGISTLGSGQTANETTVRNHLDLIRKEGFAITRGEISLGVCSIAVPIFGIGHQVLGAIDIAGPDHRFSIERARESSPLLIKAAQKISATMGLEQ